MTSMTVRREGAFPKKSLAQLLLLFDVTRARRVAQDT